MATLEQYLTEYLDLSPVWLEKDRIAFLSTRSGYQQIWEMNLKTGELRQRTFFKSTVLQMRAHLPSRQILFTLDPNGSENGQPYLLGYDEETPRQLLDRPKFLHDIAGFDTEGKKVYYLSNARDGIISDICCLDLETGEENILFTPDKPMAQAYDISRDGRYLLYHILSSYECDRVYRFDIETGAVTPLPGDEEESVEKSPYWTACGERVYLCTNRGRDRTYAAYCDLKTNALGRIYESEKGECRCAAPSPDGKFIAIAVEEEGYNYIELLDAKTFAVIKRIEPMKAGMGSSGIVPEKITWAGDSSMLLFQLTNGTHPLRLWAYYPEKGEAAQLTKGRIVPEEDLVDMELKEFRSFDGLRVPYFLYRPKGCENAENMPVMIEIHGGPECQRYCEYDSYLQFIVSQGVAVVAPNIRGSSGYGRHYCHLDDKEKRLDSVKDIEYLVKHIVEEKIANPDRIAVSGVSYGGFMTLSCCARLPELWACAVDRVGMFNLKTFMENTSPYRRAWRETEYGSLEDGDLLYRVSPAAKADQMKTPLIVVHGNNDPRVPISETEQLVEMLEKKGVEVQFVRYSDEGHAVKKLPNIIDSITRVTAFVLKYIG